MPGFDTLLLVALALVAMAVAVATVVAMRGLRRGEAADALAEGRLEDAMGAADQAGGREELLAAAVAAKHLLQLERARDLLDRILEADPEDGEVWLERGLATAYAGHRGEARTAFARAETLRPDLTEALALHRAWLALAEGDPAAARRLFEEVEAPVESKLRIDMGAGDPVFAEWYFQAAALWEAAGETERAAWAWEAGRSSAPGSRLPEVVRVAPRGEQRG